MQSDYAEQQKKRQMKNETFEKLAQSNGISFETSYDSKEGNGVETAETVTTLMGTKITRYTFDGHSHVLVFGREFSKDKVKSKPNKRTTKR